MTKDKNISHTRNTSPCPECGSFGKGYNLELVPVCKCCSEVIGSNFKPVIFETCLNCYFTTEIQNISEELFDLLNINLYGMEIIDG